jgi:LysM repeat protein
VATPKWKVLLDHLKTIKVGVYEVNGNNDTPFGRQFGENGVAWCVIFDWCIYSDVGLAGIVPKVDNVTVFSDWARARSQWSGYPSVGAWINFGNGTHTEMVTGFTATTVTTKGGNTSLSGGTSNGVFEHTFQRTSPNITGYFAPRFPDGLCPPTADPNDPRGGAKLDSWKLGDPLPYGQDGGTTPPPPVEPPTPTTFWVSQKQVLWASQHTVAEQQAQPAGATNSQDDVLQVQKGLAVKTGLDYSSGPGLYGDLTRAAVKTFQTSIAVVPTGVPDPITLMSLGLQTNLFKVNDFAETPPVDPPPVDPPTVPVPTVKTYTTVDGDSVQGVATAQSLTVAKLLELNPSTKLKAGQVLVVGTQTPPPVEPPVDPPAETSWVWSRVGARGEESWYPNSASIVHAALKKEFPTATFGTDLDGTFGSPSRLVYARWQESLGYSGDDASGEPGITSLTALGVKYKFEVREGPVDPANPNPPATPGKITWSQMTGWNLAGTFKSGKAACEDYIRQACAIMGLPTTYWVPGMSTITSRETAYNSPQWQVNTTDSNAKNVSELFNGGNAPDGKKGQCSRGMVQCIPQTFCQYHVAGTTTSIYDPVASAAAGISYIIAVYKVNRDGSNLTAKVQQADPNKQPKGY